MEREQIDSPLGQDEETKNSWREYLTVFETRMWPIFQSHGLTKGEALIVWKLNELKNLMDDDLEQIHEALNDRSQG